MRRIVEKIIETQKMLKNCIQVFVFLLKKYIQIFRNDIKKERYDLDQLIIFISMIFVAIATTLYIIITLSAKSVAKSVVNIIKSLDEMSTKEFITTILFAMTWIILICCAIILIPKLIQIYF